MCPFDGGFRQGKSGKPDGHAIQQAGSLHGFDGLRKRFGSPLPGLPFGRTVLSVQFDPLLHLRVASFSRGQIGDLLSAQREGQFLGETALTAPGSSKDEGNLCHDGISSVQDVLTPHYKLVT